MTAEGTVHGDVILESFLESPQPDVVFEESDAEVVVVNLNEGVYYFLGGPAAFVWMALHSGKTGGEVVTAIAGLDDAPPTMPQEVLDFVARLIELNLLQVVAGPRSPGEQSLPVVEYFAQGYRRPELETYSDLQDILLLDPIHDVDDTGWPAAKTE
jgi:hypothetical protein